MKRSKVLIAAALTALPGLFPLFAFAAGPGTSAATFLNLGFGARPLSVGEAYVAVADDASALHYNPAGLAYPGSPATLSDGRKYEMLVSHSVHIQDIQMTQLGFMKRPYGFSVTHLGLGGIERRTAESAQPEGSFGASDLMLGASIGRKYRGIGFGATGKLIRQSIGEYSATAYAIDMGALYRMRHTPLSFGAGLTNVGTKMKFVNQGFPLPTTLRVGMTYGLTKRFPHALSLQIDLPRDNAPALRLGMEYLGFGPISLRAGYRTYSTAQRSAALGRGLGSAAPGLAEFYGMFMGFGFRSKIGNLDYAILPIGELGNAHRLSFTLKFGRVGSRPATVKKMERQGPKERMVERLPVINLKQWGPR
ncbi:MAG: PorV/PorQ family protein [Elusimicrobiota bacterium]